MVDDLASLDQELDLKVRTSAAATNDTSVVTALLANHPDSTVEARAMQLLPQVKGAFCFVWMDEDTLYAARHPQGIRPLVIGRLERGWVVASATAALDIVGASYMREANAATNDAGLGTALLGNRPDITVGGRAMQVLPQGKCAFCVVWMDEDTLYAARDPQGIRPVVIGRRERGWVVASETAALDIGGASYIREVEPGEMVIVDEDGLRTRTFAEPEPKHCLFEFVYLARPDTIMTGKRVHSVRVESGRRLARWFPAYADLVTPVPESGKSGKRT